MSTQSPKGSKRNRIRKWAGNLLQRGGNRVQTPSPVSERPSGPISQPMGTQSTTLTPPARNDDAVSCHTSTVQLSNVTELAAGASTPVTAPVVEAVDVSPGPAATEKVKEAGKTAWIGLKMTLQVLEKSVDAFAPLKSALNGFIDCLDVVEAAAANRKEYDELATDTKVVAESLREYLAELGSEERSHSVTYLVSSIATQVSYINEKRARRKAQEVFESTQDRDDCDVTLRTWKNTDKQRMESLLQNMSPADDARYNSRYSMTIKRRGCTKETREQVQADLQDWVRDPDGAKVYWMNGMAGTGKTTIAYSLCEWLEENKQLGGSFFCSRSSPSCRDGNEVVPTIAYQLARYSPAFRSSLCKLLDSDPDASKLNITQQFRKLILGPMQEVKGAIPGNVVVVIDALDECENTRGVRFILEALLQFASSSPLKFFVTSRPEPMIVERMRSEVGHLPSIFYLHDIEQAIVEEDIKKFITEALGAMYPPPSEDNIAHLAKRAGKLFIYAATVVRYIYPEDTLVDSSDRLQTILQLEPEPAVDNEPSRKYDELDQLYTNILTITLSKHLEQKEMRDRRLVIWTIVCLREPLPASAIATLLGLSELQVSLAVRALGSVLYLSLDAQLVSMLHASFHDYMHTQHRSKSFHCDLSQHSQLLAYRCFEVMKQQLQFNICNLKSSSVFDKDIPELPEQITKFISPALSYACRNWSEHLQLTPFTSELDGQLVDFVSYRLLFWMEVINLEQCGGIGIKMILQALNHLKGLTGMTNTRTLLIDVQDFVTRFFSNACSRSTPHIYISAVPYSPQTNAVYMRYSNRLHRLIDVKGTAISQRRQHLRTTWRVGTKIGLASLSPDGTRVVSSTVLDHSSPSGAANYPIRIWDLYTGDTISQPLVDHKNPVHWLAFSLDKSGVASGSDTSSYALGDAKHIIQVWDAHTGSLIAGPLEGHTAHVNSVSFSPDGTRIVSSTGSYAYPFREFDLIDCSIRVWDSQTGSLITGPLKGHTAPVHSVAFSPDGTRIVSGSGLFRYGDPDESVDCTIRVWDASTGNLIVGPFKGHTAPVNSVAFSPDGVLIVSGSGYCDLMRKCDDCTVRVWDAHTGALVVSPLEGHTEAVYSVAFSPDGARVVSGSGSDHGRLGNTNEIFADCTIRVWDVRTGNLIAGPFEGHTGPIRLVAFSPDNTLIVSSSDDGTIRLWDAQLVDTISRPFLARSSIIQSIGFSPDGGRIVSGSGSFDSAEQVDSDCTIRVWNARTGSLIVGPLGGHITPVHSVAFSPNGARIVSGSGWLHKGEPVDCTIRVWDAHTGSLTSGPFQGHTAPVNSVAFSPDGTRIVSGSGNRGVEGSASVDCAIRVWDANTGNLIVGPFEGHTAPVNSVAFSPDGSRIASGSGGLGNSIRLVITLVAVVVDDDTPTPEPSEPSGDPGLSKRTDCTIRVWDACTGSLIAGPFEGHTAPVNSVAFSPDGTRIVSGAGDSRNLVGSFESTIRVWDAHTGSLIAGPFKGHEAPINLVAFSPDSTRIISGANTIHDLGPPTQSNAHIIRAWDTSSGDVVADPFTGHIDLTKSLAISPDGTLIAATSRRSRSSAHKIRILALDPAPNLHHAFNVPWSFHPDGWVTAEDVPIFWAPPDLHEYIPNPQETLVIGQDGSMYIDYRDLALGENWAECYIADSSSL